jgi:hypothetical protein
MKSLKGNVWVLTILREFVLSLLESTVILYGDTPSTKMSQHDGIETFAAQSNKF